MYYILYGEVYDEKNIYRTLVICLFFIIIIAIKSYGASEFSYELDTDGKATIIAYNGTESNLTIPSTIDGHNVVAIGAHAFDESRNSTNGHTIKNLVISEGIERIELLAFVRCENLETVKLPESLTFLDMQTFLQCSNLKSINIPSKINKIANSTFQETGFTEFDIPENVKSIDSMALGLCSNLEKVRVYSKDITYASRVFEKSSPNLVLYGYEGSTTQTYAQQNGIEFKPLSSSEEPPTTTMGSIYLNKNELSLMEGENEILTVSFIEISSDTKLIWSSSDEKVVTVENGKVIARGVGKAIITVATEDGKYKDECIITVVKASSMGSDILPVKEMNKTNTLEKNSDNTIANSDLPRTGNNKGLITMSIITIILIVIFIYKKYTDYKDIK